MEIKVYLNIKAERPCFVRLVPFNSSVEMDFNLLLKAFRLLYGDSAVVEFKVID